MKLRSLVALFLPLVLFNTGCGYFMAGTWADDPGNWKRTFHSTKPPDVTVTHSKYWSAHWTLEFEYYFEIAPNTQLKEQLLGKNNLRLVTGDEAIRIKKNVFGDAPSWFAPKNVADYEVWVYAKAGGNFSRRHASPLLKYSIARMVPPIFTPA